jgi:HAD superfamily hydrolase (TIGR01509 family)
MVDVALFELEGVVFETRELRLAGLRDAIAAHGLGITIDPEMVGGLAPRAAISAALSAAHMTGDEVLVDLLTHRAERAFSARLAMGGIALRANVRKFIEAASNAARLGVVTRAHRSDADAMIRLSGLESAFSVIVCADDTLDVKPSPDGYELALDRLKRQRPLARGAVLALEDGLHGIRAARAANLRCIAIGPLPAHVALEADAYVPSLQGQSLASLDQLSRPGQERVQ